MKLLDLFSCAGGAAAGYALAGFGVVGVDINPQPNYPFEFHQGDALEFLAAHGHEFDVIHASPPCQRYSAGTRASDRDRHPDLVDPTRQMLREIGVPYVIENVAGAPLEDPILLCGRMFGLTAIDDDGTPLQLDRHRIFESSMNLEAPPTCRPHRRGVQVAGSYDGARRDKHEAKHVRHGGYTPSFKVQQDLLGITWMKQQELWQAIPPAYTEFIGCAIVEQLEPEAMLRPLVDVPQ